MGMPVRRPLLWHRRLAMIMGGQLPEEPADAEMVMLALHELRDDYLSRSDPADEAPRSNNIIPFGAG